jgi:acetoin utilization deacetylase AcuC-like enzyme
MTVFAEQPILVWSESYKLDLKEYGIEKPFAFDRGESVLRQLQSDLAQTVACLEPRSVTEAQRLLVHSAEYLETLNHSNTWREIFELKDDEYFPDRASRQLSDLYDYFKIQTGGTIQAAEVALKTGLSANLGGGFHHAYPDRGTGFCAINDVAIAARFAQANDLVKRVMIVDLDFHQGDGTAKIFQDDTSVFTLSVHSEEGWPEQKQVSDLDVGILNAEQNRYLERVEFALDEALSRFAPDLVFYLAGSDPYEHCALPGSHFIKRPLSEMRRRDELVIDRFREQKIPLAMVFSGGYGTRVWEVHYYAVKHMLERASCKEHWAQEKAPLLI